METVETRYGETRTKWSSHKHPDNPNFMQIVYWIVWEKPDGRITVCYHLGANGKAVFVRGISKEQAIARFTD